MYICVMNANDTRDRILQHMFLDMRKNGFQGLRADKVIADMGLTKGALYHYFDSKQAIGTAVLDEIIRPNYLAFYHRLADCEGDPIPLLQEHLHFLVQNASDEDIALGCPLNNLVQEMSPIDEDFRVRMKAIVEAIQHRVGLALQKGKEKGFIKEEVDCVAIGRFFFAAIEGAYSTAKVSKDAAAFAANLKMLGLFLESLRKH